MRVVTAGIGLRAGHVLTTLKADFLLENVELAQRARKQVAWGAKIPDEIFFNNILAYANVDEARSMLSLN